MTWYALGWLFGQLLSAAPVADEATCRRVAVEVQAELQETMSKYQVHPFDIQVTCKKLKEPPVIKPFRFVRA